MRFLTRSLMGMSLLALTLGLLLLAGNTMVTVFKDRAEDNGRERAQRERVFAVTVEPIELRTVRPVISAFGEVVSGRTLELRAASGGALVQLSPNFREGSAVGKGELLFQTDPASAKASLSITQTEWEEAKAELAEAKEALGLSQDELAAAERQVGLRSVALERQRSLVRRRIGTEAAVESAELSFSTAEQSVLAKRQTVANAKARINRAEIALSRRKINFDEAARMLADLSVRAEFDGVLTDVSGVLGGLVNQNEKLGQLIDPTRLEVAFRISNESFADLMTSANTVKGAEVQVRFAGLDQSIKATVERVGAAVGEGQTGRELFATINPGQSASLRPGDFVSVALQEPEMSGVAIIPATASTAQGEVLLLGEEDRLEAAIVKILRKQGDDLIVDAREFAGRSLVKQRAPQLGEGIKVKPREDTPPVLEEQEMVKVDPVEAEKLMAAVAKSRMPDEAKARIEKRLKSGEMTKESYDRLQRMAARSGGGRAPKDSGETVQLSDDDKQKISAFVDSNGRMPDDVKARIRKALDASEMPKDMYDRLSQRIKG